MKRRKRVISKTGEAHGFGSSRYRWVSHLTPAERNMVVNNTADVYVRPKPLYEGGYDLYAVRFSGGRFDHYVDDYAKKTVRRRVRILAEIATVTAGGSDAG